MNIIDGEGLETLCNFLKKPVPGAEFPHILPGGYSTPDDQEIEKQSSTLSMQLKKYFRKE